VGKSRAPFVSRGLRGGLRHTEAMAIKGRSRTFWAVVQSGTVALACGQIGGESEPARATAADPPGGTALIEQQEASADNGQTASTHENECSPEYDAQCAIDIDFDDWRLPEGRAELVGAACTYGPFLSHYPLCECRVHRSRLEGDERPWGDGPDEVLLYPGARSGGCSERGRLPSSCLYCGNDFPGCNVDDAASCDAICADMARRYDTDMQKTFSVESRVARCAEEGVSCAYVTEIDGLCYARDPREKELPSFDCSLDDAQILEHRDERHAAACAELPVAECEVTSDCPRGLACDRGTCVTCGAGCGDNDGRVIPCPGAPACADGELCLLNTCVPAANLGCELGRDCPEGEICSLSGMDLTGGRGNGSTRTLCLPRDFGP
jgi:hypothetical protein